MHSTSLAPCQPRPQCFSLKNARGGKREKRKKKERGKVLETIARLNSLWSSDIVSRYQTLPFRQEPIAFRLMKGNPRQSWILDFTPWIPDCRYCIPVFVSGTWILDSKAQDFGFHEQSFSVSRNSESLRWHEPVLLNHNIVIAITWFPWITCALVFIRCLPISDLATDTDCDTIMTFRTFENVSREVYYFISDLYRI